jgi:O-antigen/teichoic acid export membrane protein
LALLSETAAILLSLASGDSARGRAAIVISRNMAMSLIRVAAVAVVALALPAYLTHRLPVDRYAAWVLILQLGAYVSYLDFGIQTGVSKFVAEHSARGDRMGAGSKASSGLALMLLAGCLGLLLTPILAWRVPALFAGMSSTLFKEVRISIILVGFSLSLSLVCSIYSAVLLGLQRYGLPVAISVANRIGFSIVVIAIVARGGGLIAMSIGVVLVNISTGIAQVLAWRYYAYHIPISLVSIKAASVRRMAIYCFYQSIWTAGMLCVSGLDIVIVGHYDYSQTAYYAIAALPISFLSAVLASILGPVMPAASAMSARHSPSEMGRVLIKLTRYSTVILLLTCLSAIVLGFPLLRIWVGREFAIQVLPYLRLLMIANVIRNLCAPYATMICATGRQKAAVIAAIAEAVVNLGCSIALARRYGAIGVAAGTLIGSFVSIVLHITVTMRRAHQSIAVSRSAFFREGLLQPMVIAIPSFLLLDNWWRTATLDPPSAILWLTSTVALAWLLAINRSDRTNLLALGRRFCQILPGSP